MFTKPLAALPLTARVELGGARFFLAHGAPREPRAIFRRW
jgi:hypothetical protein